MGSDGGQASVGTDDTAGTSTDSADGPPLDVGGEGACGPNLEQAYDCAYVDDLRSPSDPPDYCPPPDDSGLLTTSDDVFTRWNRCVRDVLDFEELASNGDCCYQVCALQGCAP